MPGQVAYQHELALLLQLHDLVLVADLEQDFSLGQGEAGLKVPYSQSIIKDTASALTPAPDSWLQQQQHHT